MFNFPFGNLLYYPLPNPSFEFPPQQRFMPSMLPYFQTYRNFIPQENLDREIILTKIENHQQERRSNQKFQKYILKRTNASKNLRKIKKQKKTSIKSPKKIVFKNCYLSFATHKLLTFIGNKMYSQRFMRILLKKYKVPEENQDNTIKVFYQQHDDVIKYIVNNASIRKLRQLWTGEFVEKALGKTSSQHINLITFLYRSLSKIYFDQFYCSFILRSKKVRKLTVPAHLKMRKYLLQNLKNPDQFICYQGFQ